MSGEGRVVHEELFRDTLFESTFYKVRRRGMAKMFFSITFFPNIKLAVVSVIVVREIRDSKRHAIKSD